MLGAHISSLKNNFATICNALVPTVDLRTFPNNAFEVWTFVTECSGDVWLVEGMSGLKSTAILYPYSHTWSFQRQKSKRELKVLPVLVMRVLKITIKKCPLCPP